MIIDITEKVKIHCQALIDNRKQIKEDAKHNKQISASHQMLIFNKFFIDLRASMMQVRDEMQTNREMYFSNTAHSYQAFTDHKRNQFESTVRISLSEIEKQITQLNTRVEQTYFCNQTAFNLAKKNKLLQVIEMEIKPQNKKYIKAVCTRPMEEIDEQLEKEAELIALQKTSQIQEIKETQKALQDISNALQIMSNKVLEQELLTSSFMVIGETGLFHIQKGNRNLIEANQLSKQSGKYWIWLFLLFAFSLLIYDFIKS